MLQRFRVSDGSGPADGEHRSKTVMNRWLNECPLTG